MSVITRGSNLEWNHYSWIYNGNINTAPKIQHIFLCTTHYTVPSISLAAWPWLWNNSQQASDGFRYHLAAVQAVQWCHILQLSQEKCAIQTTLNIWQHLWVRLHTMQHNQNLQKIKLQLSEPMYPTLLHWFSHNFYSGAGGGGHPPTHTHTHIHTQEQGKTCDNKRVYKEIYEFQHDCEILSMSHCYITTQYIKN
jgi:hypothetical protein